MYKKEKVTQGKRDGVGCNFILFYFLNLFIYF